MMGYIVMDLEWNQPPHPKAAVRKPIHLLGEIVQIGAVKLDEAFGVIDTFNILVAPKYYRKMHKRISRLTKISDEDLEYGFPFEESWAHFWAWCGEDCVFLTWGDGDMAILRDNLLMHKLDAEHLPECFNVQIIFDAQIARENRQCSLQYALEKTGEAEYERLHDALNDARNTALVCQHLDMEKGLRDYHRPVPQKSAAMLVVVDNLGKDRWVGEYRSRAAIFQDDRIARANCPVCEGFVRCEGWVTQNAQKKIALARCEVGHELFVRLKFGRLADGTMRVSRMIYLSTEENRAYYDQKHREQRAKPTCSKGKDSCVVGSIAEETGQAQEGQVG